MNVYNDDPKLAEITRLNHQLTEMWALADEANDVFAALYARALVRGIGECPETHAADRWFARYQEARER